MKKPNKNNSKAQKRAIETVEEFIKETTDKIDPMGMYTGNPTTNQQQPTQDADDL